MTFKPYSVLLVTSHFAMRRRVGLCVLAHKILCQQKEWDRGRWVEASAGCCAHGGARLDCKRAMVGTGWTSGIARIG